MVRGSQEEINLKVDEWRSEGDDGVEDLNENLKAQTQRLDPVLVQSWFSHSLVYHWTQNLSLILVQVQFCVFS